MLSFGTADFPDDVHHANRAPMLNKLGGAGTYATMGARLFRAQGDTSSVHYPRDIGFVVHAGSDFPKDAKTELESWNTKSLIVQTPERLTTRGRNMYRGEVRGS